MLLTKKSEYALLALLALAKSSHPKNIDVLAKEVCLSKSFLAKVMQNLAKNNIVKSYRGINGGFALDIPYEKLTVLEIILAAEQRVPYVFECSPSLEDCPAQIGESCLLWPLLNTLQTKINGFFEHLTLKDISQ